MIDGGSTPVICDPGYFPFSASLLSWYAGLKPLTAWSNVSNCALRSGYMCCKNLSYSSVLDSIRAEGPWDPFAVPVELRNEALYDRLILLEHYYNSTGFNFTGNLSAIEHELGRIFNTSAKLISDVLSVKKRSDVLGVKLTENAKAISNMAVVSDNRSFNTVVAISVICVVIAICFCLVCMYFRRSNYRISGD